MPRKPHRLREILASIFELWLFSGDLIRDWRLPSSQLGTCNAIGLATSILRSEDLGCNVRDLRDGQARSFVLPIPSTIPVEA